MVGVEWELTLEGTAEVWSGSEGKVMVEVAGALADVLGSSAGEAATATLTRASNLALLPSLAC